MVGVVIFITKDLSCASATPPASASVKILAAAAVANFPCTNFTSSSLPDRFLSLASCCRRDRYCPDRPCSPLFAPCQLIRAQQRVAGHLLRLRQFHQFEQRRRDVGEAAFG